MTLLLALAAAASWGTSDFLGGLAGRRIQGDHSATVALASQGVGLVGFVVVAPLVGGVLSGGDVLWSIGAGLTGAVGVMYLFRGLALGRMGVVAPITGALAAAIPSAVSPLIGEAPPALAWAGIVLALVAIVVVAREPDGELASAASGSGIREAVLAGCGFAGVGICLNATSDASELLALVPMKLVATLLLTILVWRRREQPRAAAGSWHLLLGTGILDNTANVAYLYALRNGDLAIAATVASLYPVGTTLLARVVLNERLARVQQAGFGLAVAAVVIIGIAQ